jgi:tricarballylate dehydrogenase
MNQNPGQAVISVEGPWDVVVVGHGAAGLTAAMSYLENVPAGTTPRIAVLDRTTVKDRGGSTAWTTSGFRLDENGQLDPEWASIVRESAGRLANDAYITAFYENATDTLNWLRRRGVRIGSFPTPYPLRFGKKVWCPSGGGRHIIDTLTPHIEAAGAQIFYSTVAMKLVTSETGSITGVVVRDVEGNHRTMTTSAVVLACGGFEGNPEMLSRYLPNAHELITVSPGTLSNKGDGIRMAVEVGADTAGQFDGFHLEPVDPRSMDQEALVSSWLFGILVNRRGQRFLDEAEYSFDIEFDVVANKIFRDQGGVAYAICDSGIRSKVRNFDMLDDCQNAPIRADTIRDLAELLGIPGNALQQTIDDYNAATTDAKFDSQIFDGKCTKDLEPAKSHWAEPLATPPFEAVPIRSNICFTFGGLRVDGETHVLNTEGNPIPGLYAAGEITGIFYGVYPSGTSVLRSLTFGKIAGGVVAAEAIAAHSGDHLARSV